MCTYLTEKVPADGSAKGGGAWFRLAEAVVYFDHPVHALAEHSLNIDFTATPEAGGGRVAVELTAETARQLIAAIQRSLDSAPEGLAV